MQKAGMARRLAIIVVVGALMLSVTGGVSADRGGAPSERACQGQVISYRASNGIQLPSDAPVIPGVFNPGSGTKLVGLLCEIFGLPDEVQQP